MELSANSSKPPCPTCGSIPSSASQEEEEKEKEQEEISILTAQRDHFSTRCSELEIELRLARAQLSAKFSLQDLVTTDTSIFEHESLERLREWGKCVAFCIEEKEEAERLEGGREGGKGKKGMELPFSPLGLSGFLTRNHRLTQKFTEYPEMKSKAKERVKESES